MKKWLTILLMLTGLANISLAQSIIDKWDYNVADGGINTAASSSELGGGGAFWGADGNANVSSQQALYTRNDNGNYFKDVTPSVLGVAGATSGEFECEWDFVSVDFANTAALDQKATWACGIRGVGNSDVMLRLMYEGQLNITNVNVAGVTNIYADADQIQLMVKDADFNWTEAAVFPGSSISDLNVRINYNLFNGTVDFYYTLGAGSEVSLHSGNIPDGWAISSYRQAVQFLNGGSIWEAGDDLRIDNLTYTQIQEPFDPPALALIDLWTYAYNTNGAALSEGVSTGFVGGVSFSAADMCVISNNMLLFQHTSTNTAQDSVFRTATPSLYAGGTTGIYEMAWDYVAADFSLSDATNGTGNVGMTVRDTANGNVSMGFRLRFDGNNFLLQLDDANGNSQTMATFAGPTLNNLSVSLFMDLNNSGNPGSASLFYSLDGGVDVAATYNGTVHPGFELSQYRLIAQSVNGGNNWQLGDTVFTDNLKFEKVAAMPVPPVYSTVVDYQMNDTAGTLLEGLSQTGSDTGHVVGNDPFIATDGAGALVWSGVTNSAYRSHIMATTFTEGLHRLEYTLADWDMSSSSNLSAVKMGLYDDAISNNIVMGLQVNTNSSGMRIRVATVNGDSGNVDIPGYSTGTGVVLRIDVNLDAGTYVGSWKYTTDADFSVVKSGSLGDLSNIANVRFITADNGWGASDFVKMDYATYSTTSTELPWTPASRWAQWLDLYPGLGASTNETDDFDLDGYNNVYEYGLGGDPTVPLSAHIPEFGDTEVAGGTNYILYVYAKLKDNASANRGLNYYLQTTDNLVFTPWTNAFYEVVGTGSLDAEFNAVTNRVSTDAADVRFIKLKIDLNL